MWEAEVVSVVASAKTKHALDVVIEYTDGTKVIQRDYIISEPETIPQIARDMLKELARQDKVKECLVNPPLGKLNFTPPPPTLPTKESRIDEARETLKRMKEEVALGIRPLAEFEAAVLKVKTLLS